MKTSKNSLFVLLSTRIACLFTEWHKRALTAHMRFKGLNAYLMVCCLLLTMSCDNNEDSGDLSNDYLLCIDSSGETDYELSVLNAQATSVCLMQLDADGEINRVDCRYGQQGEQFSVTLNEEGLIESIGNDSLMFVFSNYEGKLVDAVILYQDEVFMVEDFECQVNWDDLLVAQSTENHAKGRSAAESIEQWQRPLYNFSEKWGFVGGQAGSISSIVHAGIKDGNPKQEIVEWMVGSWLGAMGYFNTSLTNNVSTAAGVAEIMAAIAKGGVWGALYAVITNYSSWVDFCENAVLAYLETVDNREAGLGMLNSGIGALKATLTWNFYADVDLHAFEPDGDHIYYANSNSYDSGGYLDVDNRAGGNGATENIYWEEPEEGTYEFAVDYYGRSTYNGMSQSGVCQVNILYKGHGKTFSIPLTENDEKSVTEITLPQGTYTRSADAPNVKIRFNRKEPKTAQCPVIDKVAH